MKNGFTLVEILVAMVIMAVIVGTAVVSVSAGMKSAKLRDAARTVQQYARHAKAVALLKQRPVVLTFEEVVEGGEFQKSRITLTYSSDAEAARAGTVGGATPSGQVQTLSGQVVNQEDEAAVSGAMVSSDGEPAQDPLAVEPREFEGVRVHAEQKEERDSVVRRSSVFSNVDFLNQQAAARRQAAQELAARESGTVVEDRTKDAEGVVEDDKEHSFSVVYEANGRCTPYVVKVSKADKDEDEAIVINIGQFGRPVTED